MSISVQALLEPLDVSQSTTTVIAVEQDLRVLNYLSDYICVLYGRPTIYGVVTLPCSTREGINISPNGYIPNENLLLCDKSLACKLAASADEYIVDNV